MSSPRGIPLLSGPPTLPNDASGDISCRRCAKDLRGLFARGKRCNHCGYMYCSSHANLTALMPRSGPSSGFDPAEVCSWCIDHLMVTASGRAQLKNMPLAKLRKYLDAYNIKSERVIEKADLVDLIIAARGPNGCLPRENEEYYRRHSVPSTGGTRPRGFFERNFGDAPPPQPRLPRQPLTTQRSVPNFARPDLDRSDDPPSVPPPTPPRATPPRANPSSQQQSHPRPSSQQRSHPYHHYSPPPRPATTAPNQQQQQQRPRASSAHATRPSAPSAPPPAPPAPTPTLDELLEMPESAVRALSVGVIKAILQQNHVRLGAGVLEKSELVARVLAVVDDERQERARDEAWRAAEEEEERLRAEAAQQQQQQPRANQPSAEENHDVDMDAGHQVDPDVPMANATPPPTIVEETKAEVKPLPPKAQAMAAHLERTGLCVICQDAEANMAIIDCGHLAMCRGCADLIMGSTRECPLCRTRIVTDARLLRIFKA